MNVGTGKGASVREVIALVNRAYGLIEIEGLESERRTGDPAVLHAKTSVINLTLKFMPKYSLESSVESLFI